MLTTPVALVSGQSLSASYTSNPQQTINMFGYSIQAVFTGSPNGAFKLQASLDGANWDDIADSSESVTEAGNIVWNVSSVQYPQVRVVYTRSSGTGSLSLYFFGKGI